MINTAFDVGLAYEKHPQVAIRRERFGGLAYHYGNRRLVFLRAQALVELVESLADFPTARDALAARVPEPRRAACEKALSGLLTSEVIRLRELSPRAEPVRDTGSCPQPR
jgi:putative mycofactocin binding protein MftB